MKTVKVVDEWEHPLKSKTNYQAAIQHIMDLHPELQAIVKEQVTVVMGDWPTWYYLKKLVAQVSKQQLICWT